MLSIRTPIPVPARGRYGGRGFSAGYSGSRGRARGRARAWRGSSRGRFGRLSSRRSPLFRCYRRGPTHVHFWAKSHVDIATNEGRMVVLHLGGGADAEILVLVDQLGHRTT